MVNFAKNLLCATRAQPVHKVYAQNPINERKQIVKGSEDLSERVNLSVTSGVLK